MKEQTRRQRKLDFQPPPPFTEKKMHKIFQKKFSGMSNCLLLPPPQVFPNKTCAIILFLAISDSPTNYERMELFSSFLPPFRWVCRDSVEKGEIQGQMLSPPRATSGQVSSPNYCCNGYGSFLHQNYPDVPNCKHKNCLMMQSCSTLTFAFWQIIFRGNDSFKGGGKRKQGGFMAAVSL